MKSFCKLIFSSLIVTAAFFWTGCVAEESGANSSDNAIIEKNSSESEESVEPQLNDSSEDENGQPVESNPETDSDSENAQGESQEASPEASETSESSEAETERKWTILVYMAADNELEGAGISDFNEMEEADIPENVSVLVLFDRSRSYDASNDDWTDTRLYEIQKDENSSASIVSRRLDCEGLGISSDGCNDLDTGRKETLAGFLSFARKKYRADHYGLIVWGHGRGWRGFSVDSGSSSSMTLVQTAQGIKDGMDGSKLDFLGFDACFAITLETMLELEDCSEIMAGTPSIVPDAGWDYRTFLNLFFTTAMTAENLAESALKMYSELYASYEYGSFCAVKTSRTDFLVSEFNSLASKTASRITDRTARNEVFKIFEEEAVSYMAEKYPTDFYVDVWSLVEKLKEKGFCSDCDFNEKSLEKAVLLSWSPDGKKTGPGVFFTSYTDKGIFSISHPSAYVNGTRSTDLITFVKECTGYVPSVNCDGSLLDRLFYTDF